MPAGLSLPHQRNKQLTIVAGTPQRLADQPTIANHVFIQARANQAPGIGYVLVGVPADTALNAADATQLGAELAPASATAPGGAYGSPTGDAGGWNAQAPVDLQQMGLDASVGGVYIVSWFIR